MTSDKEKAEADEMIASSVQTNVSPVWTGEVIQCVMEFRRDER